MLDINFGCSQSAGNAQMNGWFVLIISAKPHITETQLLLKKSVYDMKEVTSERLSM